MPNKFLCVPCGSPSRIAACLLVLLSGCSAIQSTTKDFDGITVTLQVDKNRGTGNVSIVNHRTENIRVVPDLSNNLKGTGDKLLLALRLADQKGTSVLPASLISSDGWWIWSSGISQSLENPLHYTTIAPTKIFERKFVIRDYLPALFPGQEQFHGKIAMKVRYIFMASDQVENNEVELDVGYIDPRIVHRAEIDTRNILRGD